MTEKGARRERGPALARRMRVCSPMLSKKDATPNHLPERRAKGLPAATTHLLSCDRAQRPRNSMPQAKATFPAIGTACFLFLFQDAVFFFHSVPQRNRDAGLLHRPLQQTLHRPLHLSSHHTRLFHRTVRTDALKCWGFATPAMPGKSFGTPYARHLAQATDARKFR